jgi:hypothetical protein
MGATMLAWSLSSGYKDLGLIAVSLIAVGQVVMIAVRIRRENVKIRLLETSLLLAVTPEDVSRVIGSFLIKPVDAPSENGETSQSPRG